MIKYITRVVIVMLSVIVPGAGNALSPAGGIKDNTCFACHTFNDSDKPAGHPDTDELDERVCIQIKQILNDINKGVFLAARHADNDISCTDCHGEEMPEIGMEVDNETCLSCHESYASLAGQTKNIMVEEQNPHKSHLGELDCTVCHHAHSRSRSYCLQCHSNFNMPIPGDAITPSHARE